MSLGEDRVRTKFNPSAIGLVDQLKQRTAELIDLCQSMRTWEGTVESTPNETARLIERAQLRYEEAAEAAVKAATAAVEIRRPTIDELEKILNSEPQGHVSINPDGSVSIQH